MEHAAHLVLNPWQNFYVVIGSSAATLTGLVFVVITVINNSSRARRTSEGTAAFTTPTVVHFGAALLVALVLSIPWPSLLSVAALLAFAGLYGVVYVIRTAIRIRRMSGYDADTEDWIGHTLMPLLAYGALLGGAVTLPALAWQAMFAFAFGVAVLIFAGIHNAWDIVIFLAVDSPESSEGEAVAGQRGGK